MKGLLFLTFITLLLFASTIESRHEPGDRQWRNVIEDESLPEAIKSLLPIHSEKEMDCNETLKPKDEKPFVKDIEPRPQASFYPNDIKTKESGSDTNEKPFAEDFEPRPNLSIYNN
ncbi:organ-specific protein P4-like [Momordica charantia]|uniref:Organ-specific protein P4-like n=1 Tax=Momordica charantia TaxID=3673 RepID=A0A6J1C2I2_MOMCH|nr:organ-specific protein P4-like [Momordica charantia]